jgi:methyltransferase
MIPLLILAAAFLPMAFEARLSARHEKALRAEGGFEPRDDVYRWMQVVYPAAFLTMAAEAAVRHATIDRWFAIGVVIFVLGKAIKYWAIATLGSRWCFRVLVPPASSLITDGPYRLLRHPNYVGVMGELAGIGLAGHALVAGTLSVIAFAVLLILRIRVEERALAQAARR